MATAPSAVAPTARAPIAVGPRSPGPRASSTVARTGVRSTQRCLLLRKLLGIAILLRTRQAWRTCICQSSLITGHTSTGTVVPTPFLYRYRFASENRETVVHLDAEVELAGPAALEPQLAGRAVKKDVDDNLATLKLKLAPQS